MRGVQVKMRMRVPGKSLRKGWTLNKYGARRTFSALCGREFSSKLEAKRAEELRLLEMDGQISDLQYQVKFVLSRKPRVSITIDFSYVENGERKFEEAKGVLTRDFRTKLAWLYQHRKVDVVLIRE